MREEFVARLSFLFNVKPGEGRLVTLLIVQSFLIGSARIFTRTSAYALFLDQFGAEALPYVYIGIGLVVTLLSFFYLKLSERLPLSRLLITNVGFLFLTLLGFCLGLSLTPAPWLTFALPIWYEVLWTLTNLAFWNLAGRLFNVRQGKRLFGLASAGEQVAFILGGLLMPVLVALIGTANLLVLAAAFTAGILVVLVITSRAYASPLAAPLGTTPVQDQASSQRLLRSHYVLLIIGVFSVSMVSYFVLDNLFYAQAEMQFSDQDQLASFIGIFFGVVGLLSLACRAFATGQLLRRYGVRAALLFEPLLLILIAVPTAVVGNLSMLAVLFWLIAAMKLLSAVLFDSVDLPALNITYQPLQASQRVRVQSLVEGIVYSLSIALAGLALAVSTRFFPPGSIGLLLILLAGLVLWAVLANRLGREYPKRLLQALRQRNLGPTKLYLADDGDSLSILQREMSSSHPGAVIYALNTLEIIRPESLLPLLPALLEHPVPEVRQGVLQRVERHGWTSALPAVRARVASEPLPAVRCAAVRTYAVLGGVGVLEEVAAFLGDAEPAVRRGAIVGLLRSGGIEGVLAASDTLLQMTDSPQPAERISAAQVLGEVGLSHFYRLLVPLLQDPDAGVQWAALEASGRIRNARLWPLVLDKLDAPHLWRAATASLVAAGEPAVPDLIAAAESEGQSPEVRLRLIEISGRIGGEGVTHWLAEQMVQPDVIIRSHLLRALRRCGYQTRNGYAPLVERLIGAEVARSAETLAILADLGDEETVHLLGQALENSLAEDRERIFCLLSFICDRRAILQAQEGIDLPSAGERAYALEALDVLVPRALKRMIFPLLSDLPPDGKNQLLQAFFPQVRRDRLQRLEEIVSAPPGRFGPWCQACALYAVGRLQATGLSQAVIAASSAPEPLVREAAVWALSRLDGAGSRERIASLRQDPSPQVARIASQLDGGSDQEERMLTTIEKVLALKKVSVFAETPDETLAAMAGLLEEAPLGAGETVFAKGELGDCLYIVVDGEVRVHDGDRTLNRLAGGDVFGEMALLDAEPRMASVTAVADSHLLRLDQEPFFELMDDRPEVARGLIRVLSQRLRARAGDLSEQRVALEGPGKSL